MKKYFLLIVSLACSMELLFCQDLVFGQYMASSIYTNPAFTGSISPKENKQCRLTTLYRTQWVSNQNIENFNSNYLSLDNKIPSSSGNLGFYLISDRAGQFGTYKTTQINGTYAYDVPLENSKWIFKPGISLGLKDQGVNISKLRFEDQINIIGNNQSASQESFSSNRLTKADIAIGALLFNSVTYLGFAIHNINRPNYSFLGQEINYLERRFSFQGGVTIKKGSYVFLPNIIILKQNNFSQLNMGLLAKYKQFGTGFSIRKSAYKYQNSDAMIFQISLASKSLTLNYSVEKSISNIRFYAPYSHEFGLSTNLSFRKK